MKKQSQAKKLIKKTANKPAQKKSASKKTTSVPRRDKSKDVVKAEPVFNDLFSKFIAKQQPIKEIGEAGYLGYEIIENLENKMGALALSYFASIQRLNKIIELPLKDAEETGIYDRWKTKEIYGAAMQYSEFLHEMSFLALAKIVEDTKIDIKRKLDIKFHPFDKDLDLPYIKHLRTCWALANVIKHNQSNFAKGTSESADYILSEWDISEGWYDLEVYIDGRHPLCEIYEYIPKVYLSLCAFIKQSTGVENHFMTDDWLEMVEEFYRYLLPEAAGIRIPTQEDHSLD